MYKILLPYYINIFVINFPSSPLLQGIDMTNGYAYPNIFHTKIVSGDKKIICITYI